MTEPNEQEKEYILAAIERLLAGEPVAPEEASSAEGRRLLAVAGELYRGRPEPAADFAERLAGQLESRAAGKAAGPGTETGAEPGGSAAGARQARWLPGWVTLRRAGLAAAMLLVSLSFAGLAGTLIRGEWPLGVSEERRAGEAGGTFEATGPEAAQSRQAEDSMAPPGGDASQPATGSAGSTLPPLRQVIRTAAYEIELPRGQFQEKYDAVTALAGRYGGYVASASTTAADGEGAANRGTITIRIADTGDNLERAMAGLDGLGRVVNRTLSGQDVTDEYVDLESRLRNARAHEASLLALMEKATTIEETLLVQAELNTVRAGIEQLQGRINQIENRTEFATITVEMYEEDAEPGGNGDGFTWGFVDSLKYAGWLAVQTLNFVIKALGVILPLALIAALMAMAAYRLAQRRRR